MLGRLCEERRLEFIAAAQLWCVCGGTMLLWPPRLLRLLQCVCVCRVPPKASQRRVFFLCSSYTHAPTPSKNADRPRTQHTLRETRLEAVPTDAATSISSAQSAVFHCLNAAAHNGTLKQNDTSKQKLHTTVLRVSPPTPPCTGTRWLGQGVGIVVEMAAGQAGCVFARGAWSCAISYPRISGSTPSMEKLVCRCVFPSLLIRGATLRPDGFGVELSCDGDRVNCNWLLGDSNVVEVDDEGIVNGRGS